MASTPTPTDADASARRDFVIGQQLLPALINGVLNGAIAWSMHRQASAVPLWGEGGYAVDLVATGFLLPAITWLILMPLLRAQQATGSAPRIQGLRRPVLMALLPNGRWSGALVVGLLGALLGLICVGGCQALGAPAPSGVAYAWGKAVYAATLALVLQPAMAMRLLQPGADPA